MRLTADVIVVSEKGLRLSEVVRLRGSYLMRAGTGGESAMAKTHLQSRVGVRLAGWIHTRGCGCAGC